jgi:hypothetical protein
MTTDEVLDALGRHTKDSTESDGQTAAKAILVMGPDTKIKLNLIGPPKAPAVFIFLPDWQLKQ